jgi:rSAM/selenodomain-associated transferase 1
MRFKTEKNSPERLMVFARVPERGRVKTRLATELGEDRALALYDAMLQDLLEAARAATSEHSVEVLWTASAAMDGAEIRKLFHGFDLAMQCGRNLGERLTLAFHERIVFYRAGKVIAIGTDDPTMSSDLLEHAFALLESCDWVIGPASDGGYYLIGCRAGSFDVRVFEGIDWGQSDVLARTLSKLKELEETVALLPTRSDLDVPEDVRAFSRERAANAPRTRRLLRDWGWT